MHTKYIQRLLNLKIPSNKELVLWFTEYSNGCVQGFAHYYAVLPLKCRSTLKNYIFLPIQSMVYLRILALKLGCFLSY